MQNVSVGIASTTNQFIGYWGKGDPAELSGILKNAIALVSGTNWNICPNNMNVICIELSAAQGCLTNAKKQDLDSADVWALIDENGLTLGRQAFGRVTLYWLQSDSAIWFASRLQLLLPLAERPTVSIPALYGYSCFSYVPTPLSPIAQISAVAAGSAITWHHPCRSSEDFSQFTRSELWEWCEGDDQIDNEENAIAELQTLLKAAIARQIADIKTDETVGVFLSGGLDSSVVAALLVQAGVKVRAYTLDFGLTLDRDSHPTATNIPEYIYAEQVAAALKIPLVKVDASPKKIQAALIPTIKALDLPFGDGVTVPLFLLNQAVGQSTNRDIRIIFNGEGGDQLFAGWTNKPLIAASIYQSHLKEKESFEEIYLRTFHRLWGYESQVFQPEIYKQILDINPVNWIDNALESSSTRSLLHRMRRASLMLKGAQNIHPRATNLAFAHGLRVRSPFCDLALAEWTFRLSGELCLQGACEKYILKRAVETWLPSDIVWRQKRGMGVPLTVWCLNDWWRSLSNWLDPNILKQEGRWQPDLAARIALGNLGGKIQGRRIGEILWLLIVWQLWRSHILNEPIAKQTWNHPFWLPYQFWRYFKQWQ
jgi:asparagine synthase (glutamine-hydrolysing)